jgi:hypothetical protein
MSFLGPLSLYLHVEFIHKPEGIFMSHHQYLLRSLIELGLLECHLQLAPMIECIHLTTNKATTLMDPTYYCKVVGKLRHISTTQPNVAHAITIVGR